MRTFRIKSLVHSSAAGIAPLLIAVGIAMLFAQFCWTVTPVATAVAIIALGATITTVSRPHRAVSLRVGIAVHLLVYTCLYLLFIGAICDASMRGPRDGLTFLQGIDFGVSAALMGLVVKRCLTTIGGGGDAPAS